MSWALQRKARRGAQSVVRGAKKRADYYGNGNGSIGTAEAALYEEIERKRRGRKLNSIYDANGDGAVYTKSQATAAVTLSPIEMNQRITEMNK